MYAFDYHAPPPRSKVNSVTGSGTAELDAMATSTPAAESTAIINAFAKYADDQPGDALPFYEAEGRILALWDQLNELKLEVALMEAQINPPPEALGHHGVNGETEPYNDEMLEKALKEAERECLEARATYTLKQSVVEDALMADPILKAVHSGSNAAPTARSLRPLIDRRDILNIASSNLASILQSTMQNLSKVERDRMSAMKKNQDLAPSLVTLAREVDTARNDAIAKSALVDQLAEAQADAAEAKKRWRIMKSVVAAVIAGSGIDWASDDTLRELVLDNEEDDDDE